MSRYRILDQHSLHFVTLTVVDWVDVFIRKSYKDIIIESLKYCQSHKGLSISAFVIMSNHLHLVVTASGDIPLSDILRDFKKYTAKRILTEIQTSKKESRRKWMLQKFAFFAHLCKGDRTFNLWQNDNHPILLFSAAVIDQKIRYIHENPVKEGWVNLAEHYPYSSASNYYLGRGLLDIDLIEPPQSWVGYIPGT